MSLSTSRQTKTSHRTTSRYLAALASASLVATSLAATMSAHAVSESTEVPDLNLTAVSTNQEFSDGHYAIVFNELPSATYEGGTQGMPGTKPAEGERLVVADPKVQKYENYLTKQQKSFAAKYKIDVTTSATTALNTIAADLTAAQAQKIAQDPAVKGVFLDEIVTVESVTSPEFLGLTKGNGAWRKYGIPRKAGEGVVVGIIDTGISPHNPSFSGRKLPTKANDRVNRPWMDEDGTIHMLKSDGNKFEGRCDAAEGWTPDLCSTKIISAKHFGTAYWRSNPIENKHPNETLSPRDNGGHGSHVASTAAGNFGVPMTVGGNLAGRGSGMAPAAKLAVYKACWEEKDGAGCSGLDTTMAINAAVRDGVDVINYSISGGNREFFKTSGLAFLGAASAGIFVAGAGGNSGPGPSTVNHASPWVTTVAASTHRNMYGTVKTESGDAYLGASQTKVGVPLTETVQSRNIPADGVSADDAALCKENTLDAAKAANKIVVCERGEIARTLKSVEVKRAGGVGMVHRNVNPSTTNADLHAVPSVHLNVEDGKKLVAYLDANKSAKLAIEPGNTSGKPDAPTPVTAGFSARGPITIADGDFIKPDISAPGVDVLAAVDEFRDDAHGYMSGTSMASPHVAGLAALIYGKHPNWSPMTIKSAMMTTSYDVKNADGSVSKDNFATGAGHVDPTKFFEPGLVYDSSVKDWRGFAAEFLDMDLPGAERIRAIDLNLPSFGIGALKKPETVTRTVRALTPGTYTASVDLPGFDVVVEPTTLTFDKVGDEKSFTVTFTPKDAKTGDFTHGSLTWQGPGNSVTSPVSVRALALEAPVSVNLNAEGTTTEYEATMAAAGSVKLNMSGFVSPTVTEHDIKPGGLNFTAPNEANPWVEFEIPAGTVATRIEAVSGEGTRRVHMFVRQKGTRAFLPDIYAGYGVQPDKGINLIRPKAGTYTAIINGSAVDKEGGKVSLRVYNATADGGEKLVTISPELWTAAPGEKQTFTVDHSKLDNTKPMFGFVQYGNGPEMTVFSNSNLRTKIIY